MHLSLSEFTEHLREACAQENAQFHIIYHINPDGDCIGSAFALALILRSLGARTAVSGRDSVPAQFRGMTDSIPMDTLDETAQYIAVDCRDRSRTGESFQDKPYRFWIDHHGVPEEQAAHEYVHPERSACAELILEIAEALEVPVTKQLADLLYTSLVTDTNCFRTSNTNEKSFLSAARLTRYGAEPYIIGRQQTVVKSPEHLALEQRIFAGMHQLCGGRLITGLITLDDLAACGIENQSSPALQGINFLLEIIETAEIIVMVREYPQGTPDGTARFAVKTISPAYSARAIAQHFGGGGHIPAAGGSMNTSPEEARKILEDYCSSVLS